MAEALLKQALANLGNTRCQISSAGLGALSGHPADRVACQLMLEKGLDISGHRARQITKAMIRQADLILVMETTHKSTIEQHDSSAKGKVFRLGEWGKFDVVDPYKKDVSVFIRSLDTIEQGVADWIQKL